MNTPEIRFKAFTDTWKQRKFLELYEKISEKNDLTYGIDDIISVANMYYKPDSIITDPEYLRTYNVFHLGDIAFEGNKSKNFAHGRFVENTIGNGIVSHVFEVFKPKTDYDLLFWKYLINNERIMGEKLVRCTKSSTMMTNLVSKDFFQESIVVPSSVEQKAVGNLLNDIESIIALHQHKLDTLKNYKKAMLAKMFPREGQTVPEIRFEGFTGEWERHKLADLVEIYDGVHQTPHYTNTGIMFLSVENISTLESEKFISEEAFTRDYRVYPQKGDVLMTRIGDVGTTNVVETSEKLAFYVSLALLKPKRVDSYYLCNVIQSPFFKKGLRDRTLITAIPQKINKDEIGKIDILVPTLKTEQQQIGGYFKQLDSLITLHQRKLDKLKDLKQAMLEKMFVKGGN